jgi:hypothetical protein
VAALFTRKGKAHHRDRAFYWKEKVHHRTFGYALHASTLSALLSDQRPDRAVATMAPVMIEDSGPGNFAVAVAASMYWSEPILVAGRSRPVKSGSRNDDRVMAGGIHDDRDVQLGMMTLAP